MPTDDGKSGPTGDGSYRIGVISDTHGHLSAEATRALAGVDRILHAGDLDTPEVLDRLRRIAPVVAVRGNMDRGAWAEHLKPVERVTVSGTHIYLLHMGHLLDLDPRAAGLHVVISGHTHRPEQERRDGVVYLNPGSASMPRGGHPPSVALLDLADGTVQVRFISLTVGDPE